jgi:hypothetical protein
MPHLVIAVARGAIERALLNLGRWAQRHAVETCEWQLGSNQRERNGGDVAVAPNGMIWLVGNNGSIWTSADGATFTPDEAASSFESVAAGSEGAWAVGWNGTLWLYDALQ